MAELPGLSDAQVQPTPNPVGDIPAPSGAVVDDVGAPEQQAPPPTEDFQAAPPEEAVRAAAADDFTVQYDDHRTRSFGEEQVAILEGRNGYDAGKKAIEGAKAAGFGKTPGKKGSASLDIMHGLGEAPSQVVGGARDSIQNTINLGEMLSGYKMPQLPEVKQPQSTTGSVIRGVSQFMTGFVGAGKFVKGAGVVNGMVKGALADFAAFDGHDARLSNLIESVPALKNPVTEFLAADPDDSQAVGRLKNAVEGLGLGALADGFITAVKYVGAGRKAKALTAGTEGAAAEEKAVARANSKDDFAALGDPEGDVIIKTPASLDAKAGDVVDGVKAPAEVKINFARMDTPEDIQNVIQKMANLGKKDIDGAKRGTRSWEQTKLSAEQVDAFETLQKRREGAPLNAEESLAARQLWATSGEKLKEIATVAAASPSEANLFAFRKMVATHHAIQKEILGARTETARALNAWKIPAGSKGEMASQIDAILEGSGGKELTQEMAKKISLLSEAGMDKGLEDFVNGTAFARSRSAVAQVWINALLSNPQTHVVNTLSNFGVAFQQIYERKGAEFISQRLGTEGGVELGEAMAMTHGMISAFSDSLKALRKRVAEKGTMSEVKRVFTQDADSVLPNVKAETRPGNLSAETWSVAKDTPMGRAMDAADVATSTPGRLLQHSDQFFKSIGYRMELHAQATRMASQEMRGGLIAPDGFKKRVAEIIENPPDNVKIDAVNAATYATFTGKPAATLKKIGDSIQSVPVIGRLLLPFKNTPINVATYAFERTPFAPLVKTWRADVAAGGARADIALSRMSTGTMIMSTAMDLALSGKITGKGPQDPAQKQVWERSNKAYSVKIGDTWHAYNRLDPVGFTIGMAADVAEAVVNAQDDVSNDDFEKVMTAAVFSIGNNVMSKQYMQGTAEFIEAIGNSDMKSHNYVKRLVGSAVPAGVAQVARFGVPGVIEADPYMRTADSMIDAIRRRVPGLSKDLPPYRNLWGEKMDYRSGNGWVADMVSPVYMKTATPSPIDNELKRLEYYPSMPERKFQVDGEVLDLDSKQYSRYVELAGNEVKSLTTEKGLRDSLNDLVTGEHPYSSGYEGRTDGPDGTKAVMIRNTINEFREMAKKQLLEEDAGLQVQLKEKKEARGR